MVSDSSRKRLPPYVSYRTFRNFVDTLQQQGIPARIDRSYWGDRFSGSTGIQLMAALRFLGLADANGMPTAQLKSLVSARGDRRAEMLKTITSSAFGNLLQGAFDPQTATYSQLQEAFHNYYQLSGDVSRKCIKFFVGLADDAGMPLPFITKKLRGARSNAAGKLVTKKLGTRTTRNDPAPQNVESMPNRMSWDELLLTKFPTFDPNWNDEVKMKWFAAFDELQRNFSKGR
jgi:hypothetical protein